MTLHFCFAGIVSRRHLLETISNLALAKIHSIPYVSKTRSAVSFAYGFRTPSPVLYALFLFSKGGRKQNAGSLLTTVLDTVFHGSFLSTF